MTTPQPLVRTYQFLGLTAQVTRDQWERMAKAIYSDEAYRRDERAALAPERRRRNSAAVNSGVHTAIGTFLASKDFKGCTIKDTYWRDRCLGVLESASIGVTGVGKRTPKDVEVFLRPFVQIAHLDLSSIMPDDVWQIVKAGPPMNEGSTGALDGRVTSRPAP